MRNLGRRLLWLTVVAVGLGTSALVTGCAGHDAEWHAGYNFAVQNLSQAQAEQTAVTATGGGGTFTANAWCISTAGTPGSGATIGGDWVDGCVAGLNDNGIS